MEQRLLVDLPKKQQTTASKIIISFSGYELKGTGILPVPFLLPKPLINTLHILFLDYC